MTIEQLETAIAAAKKDGAVDIVINDYGETVNFHNGRGQRVGVLDDFNEEYVSFLRKNPS